MNGRIKLLEYGASQRDALVAVANTTDSNPSGYDIRDHIERARGTRIETSNLYGYLDELAEDGHVEKEESGRRNVYSITESGRKLVESYSEWLTEEN